MDGWRYWAQLLNLASIGSENLCYSTDLVPATWVLWAWLEPTCNLEFTVVMAIVISEFLERHSKAKRTRAQAYSRALRRNKGVVQRVFRGKLRFDFQRVIVDRVAVKVCVA